MSTALQRQNTVSTFWTAAGWLRAKPTLVGLFFFLAVINAVGQLNGLVNLVGNVLGVIGAGIVHLSAVDLAKDRTPSLATKMQQTNGRLLPLLGISIFSTIATVLAALLFLLPGIYVGLRLSLAPVACVVDGEGITDSLATSWELAEGTLLKLLGIHLLAVGVTVSGFAVALWLNGGLDGLSQAGETAFFGPFLAIAPVSAVVAPIVQLALARVYLEHGDGADGRTIHEDWGERGTDAKRGADGDNGELGDDEVDSDADR